MSEQWAIEDFRDIVKSWCNQQMEVLEGKVVSVRIADNECDVLLDGQRVNSFVRLGMGTGYDIRCTPKVGCSVICAFVMGRRENGFLLHAEVVESIEAKVGDTTFVMGADGVVLNNGGLGGMVKVNELISQLEKFNGFLKVFLNVLKTPVVEAGNGAPSGLQQALNVALGTLLLPSFDGLENVKVKQ